MRLNRLRYNPFLYYCRRCLVLLGNYGNRGYFLVVFCNRFARLLRVRSRFGLG